MPQRRANRSTRPAALMLALALIAAVPPGAAGSEEAPAEREDLLLLQEPQRWRADYDEATRALGVVTSSDGTRVFAAASGNWDYKAAAYDAANGQALWEAEYDGLDGQPDTPIALAGDPLDRYLFMTGHSASSRPTVALDADTGQVAWTAGFVEDGEVRGVIGSGIVASADGATVFVGGRSTQDVAAFAYDAATGAQLWGTRYDVHGRIDEGRAAALSPDGRTFVVTGVTSVSERHADVDIVTVAFDAATGRVLWTRTHDGPGGLIDTPSAVEFGPDGRTLFVAGEDYGPSVDFVVLAYDAETGEPRWTTRYDGPSFSPSGGVERLQGMAVSHDGATVFATGTLSTGTAAEDDYQTLALDAATGEIGWVAHYDNGDSDGATAVAVHPDDTVVYVTGASVGVNLTRRDYLTLAYDTTTGEPLWEQRWGSGGYVDDVAVDLAVNPDGSAVYVTGHGDLPQHVMTVAYCAKRTDLALGLLSDYCEVE